MSNGSTVLSISDIDSLQDNHRARGLHRTANQLTQTAALQNLRNPMTHRVQRVQELIRRELGPILDTQLLPFGGCLVTIHEVSLTPDLKQCFVYVGILGKASNRRKHREAAQRRARHDPAAISTSASNSRTRPSLIFKHDDSVERGVRIVNLIETLPEPLPEEPTSAGGHREDRRRSDAEPGEETSDRNVQPTIAKRR